MKKVSDSDHSKLFTKLLTQKKSISLLFSQQSRSQTAAHLVASRQTGTATSILKTILATAGKDIRTKADNVSFFQQMSANIV